MKLASDGEARVSLCSASAATRVAGARAWLVAQQPERALCVVAPSLAAAARLMHGMPPGTRCFGWHRATLDGWIDMLCTRALAERGWAPARGVAERALCARALATVAAEGGLGRLAKVAGRPGLLSVAFETLQELRLAGLSPAQLAPEAPELARLLSRYERELEEAGLADRATRLALARACLQEGTHPLSGAPLLWLDVPLWWAAERALFEAWVAQAPRVFATAVSGDAETRASFAHALAPLPDPPPAPPLGSYHARLFGDSVPALSHELAERVRWTSAPGEAREAVEIARQVRAEASEGRRFDAMAVVVRQPEVYRGPLEEALSRAGVPAHFARGVRRPDPAGRALLALLRCAQEGLSARAFAEYLSLGQTPPSGAPAEQAREGQAEARVPGELVDDPEDSDGDAAQVAPSPSVPRRWERWLVESAVVGGRARWERRLAGLRRGLSASLAEAEGDAARRAALTRQRDEVEALERFCLPLLTTLDALPARALWATWLEHLAPLCTQALSDPARVRGVLQDLAPLGPVGPVDLDEVLRVLEQRLSDALVPEAGLGAGKVAVGSPQELLGMDFEVVFVPGLRERGFPTKELEDPLLLDARRARLPGDLPRLPARVARERVRLCAAVGAGAEALYLSYPRVDATQARPRVPSLYALELLRARDGELLDVSALSARAQFGEAARLGWPAPSRPSRAIDETEYDLAVLDRVLARPAAETRGEARYLVRTHPGLARALRARARRWSPRFTPDDGLWLAPEDEGARARLLERGLTARAHAVTGLEQFAVCPYRFYLHSVLGLSPRPPLVPVESLGPAERGRLFHAVQRDVATALRDAGAFPLDEPGLEAALDQLDACLWRRADEAREELAPAIDRVFDEAVRALRSDLRQWLVRLARDEAYRPLYLELGFGLRRGGDLDEGSREAPVSVGPHLLRGAIDLVEEAVGATPGALRATDHKTGADVGAFSRVRAGRSLQPLLYALALEALFPGRAVEGGRLWFCTARGHFRSRAVPLDADARALAEAILLRVQGAFEEGFFPAAPTPDACGGCDYRRVCGPNEAQRVARKPIDALKGLHFVRAQR